MNRVNDRLRKMLNRSPEDSMQDIDKRSIIWRMLISSAVGASVFMGKNYSDNQHSIKNTVDLTMKQMFDISEKLITEQSDEIYGVRIQLTGKILHGSIYLWLVSSVSCTQRSTYFQILYYALERWTRTHNQTMHGKTSWRGSKVQNTELWTQLMVSQWNSSVDYLLRIHHIAALPQSPRVTVKIERNTRKNHWTDCLHVDVQRHLMVI